MYAFTDVLGDLSGETAFMFDPGDSTEHTESVESDGGYTNIIIITCMGISTTLIIIILWETCRVSSRGVRGKLPPPPQNTSNSPPPPKEKEKEEKEREMGECILFGYFDKTHK